MHSSNVFVNFFVYLFVLTFHKCDRSRSATYEAFLRVLNRVLTSQPGKFRTALNSKRSTAKRALRSGTQPWRRFTPDLQWIVRSEYRLCGCRTITCFAIYSGFHFSRERSDFPLLFVSLSILAQMSTSCKLHPPMTMSASSALVHIS